MRASVVVGVARKEDYSKARTNLLLNVIRSTKKDRHTQVLLSFSFTHTLRQSLRSIQLTATALAAVTATEAVTVLSQYVYARFVADRIDQTDHLHSQKLDDFRFSAVVVVVVVVSRFKREFIHSTVERMRNEKIFIL